MKLRHQRLEAASHGYVGKHSTEHHRQGRWLLHAWRRMGVILNIWCKQAVFCILFVLCYCVLLTESLDMSLYAITSSLGCGWLQLRYCSDTRSRRVATGAWAAQLRRSCIILWRHCSCSQPRQRWPDTFQSYLIESTKRGSCRRRQTACILCMHKFQIIDWIIHDRCRPSIYFHKKPSWYCRLQGSQ